MTAEEFFDEVSTVYSTSSRSDSDCVEFFISDMDKLFEKWAEEEESK